MQRFFILRLDKDLRVKLERERTLLYQESGDSSLFTFEPCIILGPVEGPVPPFVPCPALPIRTGRSRWEQGTLYLPIEEGVLTAIRKACNTSWPTSGIYLGDVNLESGLEELTVNYLNFAILTVAKDGDLFRWHISQEIYLDSDRGAR